MRPLPSSCTALLRAIRRSGLGFQRVQPSAQLDQLEGLGLVRVIVIDNQPRAQRTREGDAWLLASNSRKARR